MQIIGERNLMKTFNSVVMRFFNLLLFLLLMGCEGDLNAQDSGASGDGRLEIIKFKTVDGVQLRLFVNYPPAVEDLGDCPAIVFFNGGSWIYRNMTQFLEHAKHYASKGIVCFRAEYRVTKENGSTPFQSLEDAKSAMRYIRKHAARFHIDPNRIAAAGGSAGGHLAAACAFVSKYDSPDDDLTVSPVPDALILFNPVIDNGPAGFGYDKVGEEYRYFSPLHNLNKPIPPTIFQVGDKDNLIPVETSEYYKKVCELLGGRCDLIIYEGAEHGFFNYSKGLEYYGKTLERCDEFFRSIEWMK